MVPSFPSVDHTKPNTRFRNTARTSSLVFFVFTRVAKLRHAFCPTGCPLQYRSHVRRAFGAKVARVNPEFVPRAWLAKRDQHLSNLAQQGISALLRPLSSNAAMFTISFSLVLSVRLTRMDGRLSQRHAKAATSAKMVKAFNVLRSITAQLALRNRLNVLRLTYAQKGLKIRYGT